MGHQDSGNNWNWYRRIIRIMGTGVKGGIFLLEWSRQAVMFFAVPWSVNLKNCHSPSLTLTARCWNNHRDQTLSMEKNRKFSQPESILKILLYLGRGKGTQGMWQWWNQPIAKGGVPPFFWPFLCAKNAPSLSHKTLLTAWLRLCSR